MEPLGPQLLELHGEQWAATTQAELSAIEDSNILANGRLDGKDAWDFVSREWGKRVILVAAGPSLDKNIETLRRVGSSIFVAYRAFARLAREGIQVAAVLLADPVSPDLTDGADTTGTPLLCDRSASTIAADGWKGQRYWFFHIRDSYAECNRGLALLPGGNTSSLMFSIATGCGFEEFVFVGHDFSWKRNFHAGERLEQEGQYWTRDINGAVVFTQDNLLRFKWWHEWQMMRLGRENPNLRFINATEGGLLGYCEESGFIGTIEQRRLIDLVEEGY